MPEFNVHVTEHGTRTATVVVKAMSAEEALTRVSQQEHFGDWGPWAPDENVQYGFSATQVHEDSPETEPLEDEDAGA